MWFQGPSVIESKIHPETDSASDPFRLLAWELSPEEKITQKLKVSLFDVAN